MPTLTLDDFNLPLQARIDTIKGALPGYNATLSEDPDGVTIHCWIPVVEGARFAVRWDGARKTRKQRALAIQADIWLGNILMDGALLLPEERERGMRGVIGEQPVGARAARPLIFKKTTLTNDEDVQSNDGFNTIKVQLTWGTPTRVSELNTFDDLQAQLDAPVHESTSKKGDAFSFGLGDIMVPSRKFDHFELVPEPGMPSITYVFRCASRKWLEAEGIIPPSPPKDESPKPKSESLPPKSEPLLKSESPSPKGNQKRPRHRTAGPEVVDLNEIKSEPESDDAAPSTPKKQRRKVKVEEESKPVIGKAAKPSRKRA